MKIYVAVAKWDYDGSEVLGVFSTLEAAKEANEAHSKGNRWGADNYIVEVFELDQVKEM